MAERAPKTDFEAWARLSARMRRRDQGERVRLLRRAGLEQQWGEVDARWFEALRDDIRYGRIERLMRYLEVCEEERQVHEATFGALASPLVNLGRPVEAPRAASQPGFSGRDTVTPAIPEHYTPRHQEAAKGRDTITPPLATPLPKVDERVGSRTAEQSPEVLDAMEAAAIAARWSVERYSWLCAELAVDPTRADELWAEAGLALGDARRAVRKRWEQRLDEEGIRERHDELVERYREAIARGDYRERPFGEGTQRL